ncbi:putative nuclear distribution protein ro10 [Golovinomyces cichoracearum]|uniref:Putative nuclear distribution protein ro10 n=1 Tax=Golovinomyces cichoracearum TaxID=62708 RepID=A0A420J319_9PEZI|nr:putative nuclear distribution protein ro10 [Golovinomyces cichoracearum]
MAHSFDVTALETINFLEERLRRIQYSIFGHTDGAYKSDEISIAEKLLEIEQSFNRIVSNSKIMGDLLKLHSAHTRLFQTSQFDNIRTDLDTASVTSIVMASAALYPQTASRLTSIFDLPIPPAELSAQLIELQPRISKIESIQANQKLEIVELQARSAALIEKWYMTNILQAGEAWAALETRLRQVEQKIRRVTFARSKKDYYEVKDKE